MVGYLVALFGPPVAVNARADELADRLSFWESKALSCPMQPKGPTFPSKPTGDPAQPCDDGDMTLFNGLLCYAGDERGCQGVRLAQDAGTGEWFRSPRIRVHGNDRGGASFSPDMALGVQLYLIKTRDVDRAWKWLMWLHRLVPCSVEAFGNCVVQGLPRFCAPEQGCTIRHGDAAVLAETVTYLQRTAGMPALPDGRLRGYLGSFSGWGPDIEDIDSRINQPGYSQHLAAVVVWTLRAAGLTDPKLAKATATLAAREPNNAFFAYLNEGKTARVLARVLERCPSPDTILTPPLRQWQWEREDADRAWEQSCYWDCIFIGRLLQ
jgi:hypothetical protein